MMYIFITTTNSTSHLHHVSVYSSLFLSIILPERRRRALIIICPAQNNVERAPFHACVLAASGAGTESFWAGSKGGVWVAWWVALVYILN